MNINVFQNNTRQLNFSFTDSQNNPFDISGYTVSFVVKKFVTDPDSAALINIQQSTHTNPSQGKTQILLSSDDLNIEPSGYVYGVDLISAEGDKTTILVSRFNVLNKVPDPS